MKTEEIRNTLELIRANMNSPSVMEMCVDGVWYRRDDAIKMLLDKVIDFL